MAPQDIILILSRAAPKESRRAGDSSLCAGPGNADIHSKNKAGDSRMEPPTRGKGKGISREKCLERRASARRGWRKERCRRRKARGPTEEDRRRRPHGRVPRRLR